MLQSMELEMLVRTLCGNWVLVYCACIVLMLMIGCHEKHFICFLSPCVSGTGMAGLWHRPTLPQPFVPVNSLKKKYFRTLPRDLPAETCFLFSRLFYEEYSTIRLFVMCAWYI